MSDDTGALVEYSTTNTQFEAGDSLTVTWSPISVFPLQNITVDVILYCFNAATGERAQSAILFANIANTGSAQLTIPNIPGVPNACLFYIQVAMSSSSQTFTVPLLAGIWTPPGYFLLSISAVLRFSCTTWCSFQPAGIGATLLRSVLPCPPTAAQANRDPRFQRENALISGTFHPGSSSCYRQIVRPR